MKLIKLILIYCVFSASAGSVVVTTVAVNYMVVQRDVSRKLSVHEFDYIEMKNMLLSEGVSKGMASNIVQHLKGNDELILSYIDYFDVVVDVVENTIKMAQWLSFVSSCFLVVAGFLMRKQLGLT